jgi:excisionase family DNA binding protein
MNETLTVGQAAAISGINEQRLRRLVDRGVIPAIRLSDESWRQIRRDEFVEYAKAVGIDLDWSKLTE